MNGWFRSRLGMVGWPSEAQRFAGRCERRARALKGGFRETPQQLIGQMILGEWAGWAAGRVLNGLLWLPRAIVGWNRGVREVVGRGARRMRPQ